MNHYSVVCPCCKAEYDTFPEFLDHVQTAINLAAACLPIVEGHQHDICECPSCEALRRLYPPNSAIPNLFDDNDEDEPRPGTC